MKGNAQTRYPSDFKYLLPDMLYLEFSVTILAEDARAVAQEGSDDFKPFSVSGVRPAEQGVLMKV